MLSRLSTLQFSHEPTLDPSWFAAFEVSDFEGENPLDLENVARPDASYGLVMCNNVLEHVADDRAALRELGRICRPDGFIFLAVPDPLNLEKTEDWGYPKPEHHGHYRLYGSDIVSLFSDVIPDHHVIALLGADPTSRTWHAAFVLSRSAELLGALAGGNVPQIRPQGDGERLAQFFSHVRARAPDCAGR